MNALILSISTGQGHHATGVAVADAFENLGVQCVTIDAYEYIEPKLSSLVSKGYLLSTAHAPRLAAMVYNSLVKRNSPSRKFSVPKMTNTYLAWDLKKHIQQNTPDIIVCTHVLSSILASEMKYHAWTDAVTAGIVTDFTVHPLWEETGGIDYYVTPNELLEFQMMRKGLDVRKVLPFGIPIRPQFAVRTEKTEARRRLGLAPDKMTILVMSGSMGYGKIDVALSKIDTLPFDIQIITVCGNNADMYKRIKRMKFRKKMDVYRYVNNIDLMMDAADCIVTKPGGITSSEALAKGLPMIMLNPIPGHEMRNAEFMLNNGIALYVTKSFPLEEAVFSLLKHQGRLDDLRKTIEPYAKRTAAKDLCEFLIARVDEKQSRADSDAGER
ncbi:MAG: galactosyldiacylglycerol synthase [Clostridiales Family XIII bacterium]|jgi:processive 1,2-diacylglycerol beta-glucosyltransferase|nr:galactosyldiacylglycerol synthase [Clostridiales Family XIII bacterium]